ncbi:MAG: DNA-protecting protein DprA, partial [Proteobacteria bacterium]|nr:DNA-protecting protein DprA [Pseudomonadota bacterium]
DPRSRGTNDLIRNGATLVEQVDDIVQAMGFAATNNVAPKPAAKAPIASESLAPDPTELSQGRTRINNLLSPTPVDVDELVRQSHLTPSSVLTILLELELAGRLERHPGNRVSTKTFSP